MCLYLKDKKPKVATKDITCYKVLVEFEEIGPRGGIKRKYRTPFQEAPAKLGVTLKAYGCIKLGKLTWAKDTMAQGYTHFVAAGLIHTFKTLQGARKAVNDDNYCFGYQPVIVKCVIPKGTEYFEGVFEYTGINSYASSKVEVGKRVTPEYTRYSEIMKREKKYTKLVPSHVLR